MKKRFVILAVLCFHSLFLSCSKEDDGGQDEMQISKVIPSPDVGDANARVEISNLYGTHVLDSKASAAVKKAITESKIIELAERPRGKPIAILTVNNRRYAIGMPQPPCVTLNAYEGYDHVLLKHPLFEEFGWYSYEIGSATANEKELQESLQQTENWFDVK